MFLSRFGRLKSFFLVAGRGKHNKHKGYGFVEFAEVKDTKKVLLESGQHKLDGRRIRFNFTRGGSATDIKTKMSCWFCLDNPEADKSLVVHETPEVYLALDKGPIDKFHFLAVPQAHKKSQLHLSAPESSALNQLDLQLREFFQAEKKAFIKYEQCFRLSQGVSHMLTHYISLPAEKFDTLETIFLLNVKDTKLEFFELKEGETLSSFLGTDKERFFASVTFYDPVANQSKQRVSLLSEALAGKMPHDFMRQFICRILELPDKVNWKDCVRPQEEITFLQQRMRKFFDSWTTRHQQSSESKLDLQSLQTQLDQKKQQLMQLEH